MKLKDVFRMEMYKNLRDTPYLIVIAVFVGISAFVSINGLTVINTNLSNPAPWMIILAVLQVVFVLFLTLGGLAFFMLYPFHLMNVDYRNKVMSLMVASGVHRGAYYFVKIGATLLTLTLALFAIAAIPFFLFVVFDTAGFVSAMSGIFASFTFADVVPLFLNLFLGFISTMVTLAAAVIMTKGSITGIFVHMGLMLGYSVISGVLTALYVDARIMNSIGHVRTWYFTTILLILWIILFGWLGYYILKKQNL